MACSLPRPNCRVASRTVEKTARRRQWAMLGVLHLKNGTRPFWQALKRIARPTPRSDAWRICEFFHLRIKYTPAGKGWQEKKTRLSGIFPSRFVFTPAPRAATGRRRDRGASRRRGDDPALFCGRLGRPDAQVIDIAGPSHYDADDVGPPLRGLPSGFPPTEYSGNGVEPPPGGAHHLAKKRVYGLPPVAAPLNRPDRMEVMT